MRYSIQPNDPGFKNYRKLRLRGSDLKVRLNGDPVLSPVTVDKQIGLVTRYKTKTDGTPEVDWQTRDLVTETLRGKVEVEIVGPGTD
jgi:hypothetical protein